MNFDLSDDQRMFRDAIERFLGPIDIAARRQARGAEGAYPVARWGALAELGLIALAVPEVAGGLGGSAIDLALVAESLGHGLAIDPWLENGVLPARLAAAAGDNALAGRIAAGELRAACAFAEPGRRYRLDPKVVAASATTLSGTKTMVSGGIAAEMLLVTAYEAGGFALYAVDAAQPEVQRRGYVIADSSLAAEIDFHGASGERLRLDQSGFLAVVADVRLLAAAEMLGLAQRTFDETLTYVRVREQFGAPIGSFQALQHRLVECYALLEQARSTVIRTALEGGEGNWPSQAAGAKALVGEAAIKIALEAVQFHGGMGQTDELAIGHALKRIMLLDRLFGDQAQCLTEFAAGQRAQAA